MPIVSTDIKYMLSTTAGAAGNANTSTPAASLGKYVSTTEMGTGAGALFDDVTGPENAGSEDEYREIFIKNDHATLPLLNPVIYLSSEVGGGASIAIAIDNIAASAKGSSSAQAAQIANEDTPPTGVGSFSSPTTFGTGLSLGSSLAAGQVKGVWVRRRTANTSPIDSDGVTFTVTGDTGA